MQKMRERTLKVSLYVLPRIDYNKCNFRFFLQFLSRKYNIHIPVWASQARFSGAPDAPAWWWEPRKWVKKWGGHYWTETVCPTRATGKCHCEASWCSLCRPKWWLWSMWSSRLWYVGATAAAAETWAMWVYRPRSWAMCINSFWLCAQIWFAVCWSGCWWPGRPRQCCESRLWSKFARTGGTLWCSRTTWSSEPVWCRTAFGTWFYENQIKS